MSNAVSADDVIKKIHDMKEAARDEFKTLGERVEKAEKTLGNIEENLVQVRREMQTAAVPMDDYQARVAGQAGGLFDGKFKLGFEKMLGLSSNHAGLLPRDKERLKAIHDLHDACLIRYWHERYKTGAGGQEIRAKMFNDEGNADFRMYGQHLTAAGYLRAANDIINPAADVGANLNFTLLTSELIDLVAIFDQVGSQFDVKPLQRGNQEWPATRGIPKSRLGGGLTTYAVPATDPASVNAFPQSTMLRKPTFGQVNFAAIHNLGAMAWTDDMVEDSVVPIVETLRSMAAEMIASGRGDAILNGVRTGTTHIDSDITDAFDMKKAWHGLRYLGANNEATITDDIDALDFNTLMQKLGKWATRLPSIRMFLNVKDWIILAADPDLRTANTIGIDRATLREGIIDRVFGVGIVISADVRRDLNVAGVFDGVTTNNTVEIMCDTSRFWRGQVHGARVEEMRVPQALGSWLQVDVREDFKPLDLDDTASPFQFPTGDAPIAIGVDVTAA